MDPRLQFDNSTTPGPLGISKDPLPFMLVNSSNNADGLTIPVDVPPARPRYSLGRIPVVRATVRRHACGDPAAVMRNDRACSVVSADISLHCSRGSSTPCVGSLRSNCQRIACLIEARKTACAYIGPSVPRVSGRSGSDMRPGFQEARVRPRISHRLLDGCI